MDKKKSIAIIIGTVVIIGGAVIGYNVKNKSTKATATTAKAPTTQVQKASAKDVDDITSPDYIPKYQRGVHDYKEEVQDINGEKVTVMTGTYTKDPKTSTYWLGGKKLAVPDYYTCFSTTDKSSVQIGRSENLKNAVIMKLGKQLNGKGTDNYLIVNYSGPFSRNVDMPSHPDDKYVEHVGKVVSADDSGITLDDGKKYNANEAQYIQMQNEDYGNHSSFLHKYTPNDFPKDTLVNMVYQNGKVWTIQRFCILK